MSLCRPQEKSSRCMTESNKTNIVDLNQDVLIHVAMYLDMLSLSAFVQTCKTVRDRLYCSMSPWNRSIFNFSRQLSEETLHTLELRNVKALKICTENLDIAESFNSCRMVDSLTTLVVCVHVDQKRSYDDLKKNSFQMLPHIRNLSLVVYSESILQQEVCCLIQFILAAMGEHLEHLFLCLQCESGNLSTEVFRFRDHFFPNVTDLELLEGKASRFSQRICHCTDRVVSFASEFEHLEKLTVNNPDMTMSEFARKYPNLKHLTTCRLPVPSDGYPKHMSTMTSLAVTCNKLHIHRLSWDNLLVTVAHFPNLQALDISYYNKEQPRYETLCRILDLCSNLVVFNIVAASWKARRYLSAITSKLRMLQVLILTPSDCNRATRLSNKFISSCLGSAPQLQSIIGISAGYDARASDLHGLKYLSSDSYFGTDDMSLPNTRPA